MTLKDWKIQRHQSLVYDGNPPHDTVEDDSADVDATPTPAVSTPSDPHTATPATH
jgi:hypothetical protein